MNLDWVRNVCLVMPHATEQVQWGGDLVFKIGGKMFAVASLEPDRVMAAFKCTPEVFAELVEREGIVPAPYLARAHWVALERFDALAGSELKALLEQAYRIVFDGLTKKAKAELAAAAAGATSRKPEKPSPRRGRGASPNR